MRGSLFILLVPAGRDKGATYQPLTKGGIMSEDRKGCSQCDEIEPLLRAEILRRQITRAKADRQLDKLHAEHGLFSVGMERKEAILIQVPLL